MGRSVVNRTGVASLRGGSRGARRAKPPRPAATPPREGNFGSRNFDRAVWAKRPWQLFVNGSATTYVWDGSDYLQARTVSDVTTYENVGAQILALDLDGSERLLVPDTLGSVVKLLDASGNETYDAVYWPYGSVRSSVGLNDTNAGFVGTWGYHVDGSRRLYIRARVYDPVTGRWYTVDPLWPDESAYGYAKVSPIVLQDASGAFPQIGPLGDCAKCGKATSVEAVSAAEKFCRQFGFGENRDGTVCNVMQHCMWGCLTGSKCNIVGLGKTECAEWLLDAHETDGPCPPYRQGKGENPPDLKCMDQFNNKVGIGLAGASNCYQACLSQIKSGNCQVVRPSQKYPPVGWKKCKTGCKRLRQMDQVRN